MDASFLDKSDFQWAVLTFTPEPPDKAASDRPAPAERPLICRIEGNYVYYTTLLDPPIPPAAAELLRERPEIEVGIDNDSESDSDTDSD